MGQPDALKKPLNELKRKMKKAFKNFKTENVKNLEQAQRKAKSLVNDCRAEYATLMKKEIDEIIRTEEDLAAAHQRTKSNVLGKFKEEIPIKSPAFMGTYQMQLEQKIEKSFEEHAELFVLKKAEEDRKLNVLLMECRREYFKEMEKQCSSESLMTPDNLAGLHASTKELVLEKLIPPITKAQREDLLKDMDYLFEAYKMRNDIKLNHEKGLGTAPAIGIDLGTTDCCAAVFYKGKVITIPNLDQGGNMTTPSYVAYNMKNADVVIGERAKENAYNDPENTIYDVKHIIGRTMNNLLFQRDIKMWPFTFQESDGIPKILAGYQLLYPEQVSAKLLTYLKTMAEKFLKLEPGTIKKAVIAVPAYFKDGQRQATVDAGKLAGLEVLTILSEQSAAAIAYSLEKKESTAKKVLVYDLGGGTFDVAVLNIVPDSKEIDVLGIDGNTHLGGEEFDKNLTRFCAKKFKEKTGIYFFEGNNSFDYRQRKEAYQRLRRLQAHCEKAKIRLTTATTTRVTINAILNGLNLEVEISREKFEELNYEMFRKTIQIVEECLKTVNVKKDEIDDIILIGGSTRIPKIQEMLKTFFGRKALNHIINPDHYVAQGAAIKAAMMNGEQLNGDIDFIKIQDIIPLSFGFRLHGGLMSIVVPRYTKFPCIMKKFYRITEDFQTFICFRIYQGEKVMAEDNELIGTFTLNGIPPARKGEIPVMACMKINSMGILHAVAESMVSGSRSSIIINENKLRLSEETIQKLMAQSKRI